jgi:hypothetical protein
MRKIIVGIVAVVLVAGGGYVLLNRETGQSFKTALDQAIGKLPAGYTAAYKSASYDPVLGKGSITGIAIHHTTAPVLDVTIEEVDVSQPSLGLPDAWNKALTDPDKLTPQITLLVAGNVTFKGIALHTDTVDESARSTEFSNLRVHPWAFAQSGITSFAEIEAALHPAHNPPTLDDQKPILRLAAAAILSIDIDSQRAYGIAAKVAVPATGAQPAGVLTMTYERLEGSGVELGVIGSAEASNITFDQGSQGVGSVAKLSLSKWDARSASIALLSGKEFSTSLFNGVSFGRIAYEGIDFQGPSVPPVKLGLFEITNIAFDNGVPISGGFALSGLKLTKAQLTEPETAKMLDQIGVDTLTVSAGAQFRWDLAAKSMQVKDGTFKVDELGAVDFSATGTGAEPGAQLMKNVGLSQSVIHYQDASLFDRVLKAKATEAGTTPDKLRAQLISTLPVMAAALGNSPAVTDGIAAITGFMTNPKGLTVTLAPPTPITAATFATLQTLPPPQMLTTLGLTVKAEP